MHESIFLRLLGSGVEITQLGTSHDCHLYRISGRCGREFFVKASERPHLRLFEAEAKGLQWLRETQAVAIPNLSLIHISEPTDRTRSRMPSSA